MRITCPSCEANYDVRPDQLGDNGRTVRCAQCGTKWFQSRKAAGPEGDEAIVGDAPPLETAPPPAPPTDDKSDEPAPSAPDPVIPALLDAVASVSTNPVEPPVRRAKLRKPKKPARRERSPDAREGGGLMILVLLAAALGLCVTFRQTVVRAEPGLAGLFAAVHLPVNVRGLDFEGLVATVDFENAQPVITVTGTIRNVTRDTIALPRLRLAVRNAAGAEIYATAAPPPRAIADPEAKIPFRARLTVFPREGNDIEVRFFDARDAAAGVF